VKVLPAARPHIVLSEDDFEDYEQGRAEERAATLAWLRAQAGDLRRSYFAEAAHAIERGEHEEPRRE
jgi:hypothetical protein